MADAFVIPILVTIAALVLLALAAGGPASTPDPVSATTTSAFTRSSPMHQLFAYLVAQQQADRIREARESHLAHELHRAHELGTSDRRIDGDAGDDASGPGDARRAVALVALGLSRAAAATSRAAANTSRAAAGTARRIDPCLDEAAIRRAVGAGGR